MRPCLVGRDYEAMSGGVRDGLPIEDAVPRDLWARLLAGEVTEVYLLSPGPSHLVLPQTLGLELISAEAYVYGRYGVLRTHSERAEFARALAAEPRWLAVGGLPSWVEPFARRAEAILIVSALHRNSPFLSVSAAYRRLPRAAQQLFELHDEQELRVLEADPDFAASGYIFDRPANYDLARVYYPLMRDFLLRRFPDKTLVVGAPQIGRLKGVRAKR